MRRWLLASAFAVCATLTAANAAAHPLLDEARASYDDANFEAALDALGRAEASTDLTLEDLKETYALRVLVHLGLGNDDGVEADLQRLLSIDAAHDFGDSVPPEVLERAAEMRSELGGPIRIVVRTTTSPTGVELRATVMDDPAELVQSVRIGTRRAGDWSVRDDDVASLPGSERTEYHAEAIGPGGVVLAVDGSRDSPRVWEGAGPGSDGSPWLLVGIGAGAAAVVATVVLIVVLSSSVSDQTNPTVPMVSFE